MDCCYRTTLLLMMVLCGLTLKAQTTSDVDKPNVLFIMVDDLNDYVGFLEGHPQVETPNMDRLARRGTIFTNAYCTSPSCAPSRTSIMTGKYPDYTRIYNNRQYDDTKKFRNHFSAANGNELIYTLPQIMKDSGGYFTYNFHKIYHGWTKLNYTNDFDYLNGDVCNREFSWNRFLDFAPNEDAKPTVPNGPQHDGVEGLIMGPLENSLEPLTNDAKVADSVILFLNDYAANPSNYCDKPFFAAVGIFRPHVPYLAPERYYLPYYTNDYYQDPFPIPFNDPPGQSPVNGLVMPLQNPDGSTGIETLNPIALEMALSKKSDEYSMDSFAAQLSPLPLIAPGLDTAQRRAIIAEGKKAQAVMNYLACIKFADAQIGRILDALDNQPELYENTIIVLMSDHGYSMGQREHWHKFSLWENDIRVPLIIVDPRRSGHAISDRPVSLLDVFPTVLHLTQVSEPEFADGSRYLDGQTLVPLLNNPEQAWNQPALTSYIQPIQFNFGTCFPHHSVRNEQFHYIRYQNNGGEDCDAAASTAYEELYEIGQNREVDPEEWVNLANDPAYTDIKRYLRQWLPEGPFYKKRMPLVEITLPEIGCSVAPGDSLRLSSKITTAFGSPLSSLPPGFLHKWEIQPAGISINGPSEIAIALDSAMISQTQRITLRIEKPTGLGPFLLARETIRLGSGPADADFTASIAGNTLSLEAATEISGLVASRWDFGDGKIVHDNYPASHTYSMPGAYTVSREISYASGASVCEATKSIGLNILAASFDPTECLEPGAVWVDTASSLKAKVAWSPVFGAIDYEVYYRPGRGEFTAPYKTAFIPPASVNPKEAVIKDIRSDDQVQYFIRTICASDTSETPLLNFMTEPCQPPLNYRVAELGDGSKELRWKQGEGIKTGQFFSFGDGINLTETEIDLSATATSFPLDSLNPATPYRMLAASYCEQYDSTIRRGPVSNYFFFTTPADTIFSRTQAVGFELSVYPNPSGGKINLSIQADQAVANQAAEDHTGADRAFANQAGEDRVFADMEVIAAEKQVEIFDAVGRNVYSGTFSGRQVSLDLSRMLAAGNYLVVVSIGEESISLPIVLED